MKTSVIATLLVGLFAVPVFASDYDNGNQRGPGQGQGQKHGQTVAQKKAEIIAHIEERITNSQAEKACVQSAQTHDALHACREKYRPQHRGGEQPRGGGQQGRREPQPM